MWQTKTFKTHEARANWIAKNRHRVQYELTFVNNGYGVEYRKLRKI